MEKVKNLCLYVQEIDDRFDAWKKKIFVLILLVTVIIVSQSFNTQHKEIRAIRDSLSNFYRDFDVSMLQKPAELKELLKKVAQMSGPVSSLEEINKEVDSKIEILQNLEVDKAGRPDLASKAAGGKIAGLGKDTELFYSCNVIMKLMNCPSKVNGPEKVIENSMQPGECFAFKGQKATLFIRLIGPAMIDALTVEHVPMKISPTGDVTEAPKIFNFTVSFP